MRLDDRARSATEDLLAASRPDAEVLLGQLHRRRRRRNATKVAVAAAAIVGLGGWAVTVYDTGRPEPAPAIPPQSTNGALLSLRFGTPITVAGTIEAPPTDAAEQSGLHFTSDGDELVYENRRSQVVAKNVSDGSQRVLAHCPGGQGAYCGFALSPDERRLATVTQDGGQLVLEVVDVESGRTDRIRTVSALAGPSWSPDGDRIAYLDGDGLHVMAPDGSGDQRFVLSKDPRTVVGFRRPSWSPDGSRISFLTAEELSLPEDTAERSGLESLTQFGLVVVDVTTGEVTDLGEVGACACFGIAPPSQVWSPDGEWIAVSTIDTDRVMRTGSARYDGVHLFSPDGTDRRLLSRVEVGELAWQPLPGGDGSSS